MSRIASLARSFFRPWPVRYTSDRTRSTTARSPGSVKSLVAQRPLGSTDPLRHRRLRDEERVGDLTRAEPSDGTQRERHLRRRREVGVAAPEQQQQRVIPRFGGDLGPGRGQSTSSRRRRADSLRRASTSRRLATVVSHARGSRGGCSGQTRSASTIASCTASSAAAKSSRRRTKSAST